MHERGTKATGCKKVGEQILGHYMVLSPKLVPEHSATARPSEAVLSLWDARDARVGPNDVNSDESMDRQ